MYVLERFNQKLLVEGNDDQHVVWPLCKLNNILENFDVVDSNGIDNLLSQIPIRLKQSNLNAIGIITAADNDIDSIWKKAAHIFKPYFHLPKYLPKGGFVLQCAFYKVGV